MEQNFQKIEIKSSKGFNSWTYGLGVSRQRSKELLFTSAVDYLKGLKKAVINDDGDAEFCFSVAQEHAKTQAEMLVLSAILYNKYREDLVSLSKEGGERHVILSALAVVDVSEEKARLIIQKMM